MSIISLEASRKLSWQHRRHSIRCTRACWNRDQSAQLIVNWEFMFMDPSASSFHSGSAAAAAHCPHRWPQQTVARRSSTSGAQGWVAPVPVWLDSCILSSVSRQTANLPLTPQRSPLTVINTWIAALQLHWLCTCTCCISITTERGSRGLCYHSLPRPSVMCILPSMTDKRSCPTQWHPPPATSTTNLSSPAVLHDCRQPTDAVWSGIPQDPQEGWPLPIVA